MHVLRNARHRLLLAVCCLVGCNEVAAPQAAPVFPAPEEESADYWFALGRAYMEREKHREFRERAKNVILFVGDGMGVSTVTAARILDGQLANGSSGEENSLAFERFPFTALVKTYNTNLQVPDSAGTMTAMMTGVKTRAGVISVSQRVEYGDCAAEADGVLPTLLEQAEEAGLATGVVTTARLTHATPAAAYAHSASRAWETDARMTQEAREAGCRDLARQLVEFEAGDGLEVALGGGRPFFLPADGSAGEPGLRLDNRDLTAEWLQRFEGARLASNLAELRAVDTGATRHLLGLFGAGHMQFEVERDTGPGGQPSLAEMTRVAVELLSRNRRGFFLMVEGGRIDHAHHDGNAHFALQDARAFNAAVRQAVEMTSEDDTLILVTADHSHVFTLAGYPVRGNHILGKVKDERQQYETDLHGLPYTTLGYANGPGHRGGGRRPDLTGVDTTAPDYLQEAGMARSSETHGGEDVAAYARGPGAQWVRGSLEQNLLYHIMYEALLAHRDRTE